jgi:hypothetical protein
MSLRPEVVIRRLVTLGMRETIARQVTQYIDDLCRANGDEWTVSRLKTMKVSYIHYLTSGDATWPWIKVRNNLPTGPLRNLFMLKNPTKVLNALMIYSNFVSQKLTRKQWNKFIKSVVQEEAEPGRFNLIMLPKFILDNYSIETQTHGSREFVKYNFPRKLELFEFESRRLEHERVRSPSWSDLGSRTVPNTIMNTLNSFNHLYVRKFILTYYEKDVLPKWFHDRVLSQYSHIQNVWHSFDNGDVVGRISFIQEPGLKLRAVANPYPSLQILLNPLKKKLMSILKDIDNDYAYDQDQGVSDIQEYIQLGNKVSSIDLSDATNNLPMETQEQLLSIIFGPKHPLVNLFGQVCRGKWRVKNPSGKEEFINYTRGQPMGVGPSFASFSLLHHYIARLAIDLVDDNDDAVTDYFALLLRPDKLKEVKPKRFNYWIVGDDIVLDQKYDKTYLSLIQNYFMVPISHEKCLYNSSYAEFCSRLISKDKIIRAFKWKIITDNSFLDVARMLGPSSRPLFRPKQQKVLDRISPIPDTIGGPISWNVHNLPLYEREKKYWKDAELLLESKSDNALSQSELDLIYEFNRDTRRILSFGPRSLNYMAKSFFDKTHEVINQNGDIVKGDGSHFETPEKRVHKIMSHEDLMSRQRRNLFGHYSTLLKDVELSDKGELECSIALLKALDKFPDIHVRNLTDLERVSSKKVFGLRWTFVPQVFSPATKHYSYFQKLCDLYGV